MSYDYQRRTAGQARYQKILVDIVSEVDDVTEPLKRATTKLPRLIDALEELVEKDTELQASDPRGGKRYGLEQAITEMRKMLEDVKEATSMLAWAYDELNNRVRDNAPRS